MKRLISCILLCTMLISMVSGCSKKEELPGYNIDDYKDGNSGLSGNLDLEELPDGNSSQGNQSAQNNQNSSGAQSTNKPTNKPTGNPGGSTDVDTEDIGDTGSQSVTDTTTNQNTDKLPYVENTSTTIGDTVITADSYDESKLTLPIIRIETFDGSDITSKDVYKSGTIEIDNTIKSFKKNKSAVEIRGRGNSTWTVFDKKAYKLRFSINTNLFGMGEAKKWVLLANALDETMLRNALAFDIAKVLGLEYSSQYTYVNVFVNGEYKGVYQLCEQTEEGQNRVDINSSKTGELDTGYLVESYGAGDKLTEKTFKLPDVNGKHLKGPEPDHQFVIKSPGPTTATDEQTAYIKDYVSKVNEAIFTGDYDTFSKLCDVNSFVNMFILDEVLLNNDMGYSFYMYKKAGGKLYLGPCWDFDQSCGISSHGGSTYKGWYAGSPHGWYLSLIEIPQFKALVKARYNEKKKAIEDVFSNIEKIVKSNNFDFAMSNYVYNNFGNKKRWRTMPEIYSLTTYKQHVEYLKTWITNRKIWMEDQFKQW